MSKAMEWIKEHPKTSAAIVIGGAVLLWIVYSGSSSGGSTDNGYSAALQAQAQTAALNNQLQEAQLGLQAQSNQTQAGVTANANNDATALAEATLAAQTAANQATTQAQAAEATAQYNAQATEVSSTVSAQATEYTAQQTTLQNEYDTYAAYNLANFKSSLDFLAGLSGGGVGSPGSGVITQGYVTNTGNGVAFGVESTPPGSNPWGGAGYGVSQLQALSNSSLGAPILDHPAAVTEIPTQQAA